MIRLIRDLRLITIALIASACLLALKAADFMLDDGSIATSDNAPARDAETSVVRTTPDVVQHSGSVMSWAGQMFNFPGGGGASQLANIAPPPIDNGNADITGSVAESPATPSAASDKGNDKTAPPVLPSAVAPGNAKKEPPPPGTVIPLNGPGQISGAERAILERLEERRQELETRARELDIRESLMKAAEKRMDGKLAELKEAEAKLAVDAQQKDELLNARLKGLVTMYENMKPRDAAKIFDRLDIGVLSQVASLINPRQMAEILAQMSPDVAERLTVEFASKAAQTKPDSPAELPKIEGQPTTP